MPSLRWALLVSSLTSLSLVARADAGPPDGAGRGHFPLLEFGAAGAFTQAPVSYTFDHGFGPTNDTESVFSGLAGPIALAHLDLGPLLLDVEGTYNLLRNQPVSYIARAHVGLGAHDEMNVIKSIGDTGYVQTTEYYTNRFFPTIMGFTGGVTIMGMHGVSYDSAVDGLTQRGPTTLVALDAGGTLRSPQFEFTLAPLYEITHGNFGLRYVFAYAFPFGDHLFGARFTGDHFFGGDPPDNSGRALEFMLLFALTWSTDVGIE